MKWPAGRGEQQAFEHLENHHRLIGTAILASLSFAEPERLSDQPSAARWSRRLEDRSGQPLTKIAAGATSRAAPGLPQKRTKTVGSQPLTLSANFRSEQLQQMFR